MYKVPDIDLRGDINLREDYDSLEKQFTLKVLMIRKNKNTRCKCYNELHRDGDIKCKVCGGTGRLNLIEQVPAIHENFNTSSLIKMTELGLSVTNTVLFFFNYKIMPKVQDRILIVGYDKRGLPVDIKKSCTIVNVEEIRGDNGRVEMYQVYAKYSPEKIIYDQKRLNAIPLKCKAEIMKGRRYTWPQDIQ